MSALIQGLRFLNYISKSRSIFHIHSPFVFALYYRVLKGKGMPALPDAIRKYLHSFRSATTHIEREQQGATGRMQRTLLKEIALRESASQRDTSALFRLAYYLKPGIILELGTCVGKSACAMAMGAPLAKVISVDADSNLQEFARQKTASLGLTNIEFRNGSFRDILPLISSEHSKIDLIFLDGDHRKEETIRLVQHLLPCLSSQGLILIHDIHYSEEMMEAWEFVQGFSEVSASVSTFTMGFLFVSEGLSRQRFRLRW